MEPDFAGYATKAGIKCSDGLTIMPNAFEHQDKVTVPLVWQHGHNTPENVLGHAVLENRSDGVYTYGYFNDTPHGQAAKKLVLHKDITNLSIYANQLVKKAKQVFHGAIREVSLVLAGANPGAKIDFVSIQHADGDVEVVDDEAVIYTGLKFELAHADGDDAGDDSGDDDGQTVKDIYDGFTDEQKDVVHYMIAQALKGTDDADGSTTAEHSDEGSEEDGEGDDNNEEGDLNHQEGNDDMTRNVFEQNGENAGAAAEEGYVLTHSDIEEIKENWKRGGSMKHAVEEFAVAHGIENLDALFPDPKSRPDAPQFDKRRTEWVSGVINGVSRSPFSRVKTLWADITHEAARARGYIKGNLKKEEFFGLTKRVTGPATIYKKQKLDRDDILDATELDVVAWMKAEMRMMLEEEVARAILIGDGRPVEDPANPGEPNPDKVKDPMGTVEGNGIRSILHDHELFAATINVTVPAPGDSFQDVVDQVMLGMEFYKGSGMPTFYTTLGRLNRMLLSKDQFGRRLWKTKAELASEMGVANIVDVEVMDDEAYGDLFGIIVNLRDYNVGTDRGGEVNLFDDFDLDYNQYKYLIETRFSGALTKIRSALVLKAAPSGATLVDPVTEPTFDEGTGVVTIPTQTGVTYTNAETEATLVAGPQAALGAGETLHVLAVADSGFYFESNVEDEWIFEGQA